MEAASGAEEQEEGVRPWEVVFIGRVKVRSAKDAASDVLGAKLNGAVVCGRREGEWLALEGEPGFMLIASPDGELLQQRDETILSVQNPATGAELAKLRVPTTATAVALKRRLAELHSVPLYAQQLVHGARVLEDSETLQSLGLPPALQLVRLPFDEEQGPLLLRGASHGDAVAVAEALRARACPDFVGPNNGLTPMVAAAGAGRLDLVVDLHMAGADKERHAHHNITPLIAAASGGHLKVVKYLCEMAAEVDRVMQDGHSALQAAAHGGHMETVEYLCGMGAEMDRPNDNGATALLLAAQAGHSEVVQSLCRAGAERERPMLDGLTALQYAASEGHVEVARHLLDEGAERDSQNRDGVTPLIWAALRGHPEVVRLLCDAGAGLERQTRDGATPLLVAAQNGHVASLRHLLQARADTEQPLRSGATPLHMASQNGHLEAVRYLCEAGANKDKTLPDGTSPLLLARSTSREVAQYLREAGAVEGGPAGEAAAAAQAA